MEHTTRRNATIRLVTGLFVLLTLALVTLQACETDTSSEVIEQKPGSRSDANGTVLDENGVPTMINGNPVKSVIWVKSSLDVSQSSTLVAADLPVPSIYILATILHQNKQPKV